MLVALALPRLMGYTQEANRTRLINDAKVLEDACHRYYMDHGDWPKLTDKAYTAAEIEAFAERVIDQTGKAITLDPEGKYYNINMMALSKYVKINNSGEYFVLQNPVGKVFVLDKPTSDRVQEWTEQVVDFILKKGLEKDGDLLIFPPRQRNPV